MDINDYRDQARAIQLDRERGYRKAELLACAPRADGARPGWKAFMAFLFGSKETTTHAAPAPSAPRRPTQIPSKEV